MRFHLGQKYVQVFTVYVHWSIVKKCSRVYLTFNNALVVSKLFEQQLCLTERGEILKKVQEKISLVKNCMTAKARNLFRHNVANENSLQAIESLDM